MRRNDAVLDWDRPQPMIRIAITAAAYAAIRESLPVAKKPSLRPAEGWGRPLLGLGAECTIDKLEALRGPSESLSDVIIRLAMAEGG